MADITPEIEAALEQHLLDLPGIPDIAWENGDYVPSTGVPYIEALHVPTVREPATRGNLFRTYYQGVFVLDCMVPSNKGRGAATDLTSKVVNAFEANTDIQLSGGKYLTVRESIKQSGTKEGAFYRVSVNIRWYAYD